MSHVLVLRLELDRLRRQVPRNRARERQVFEAMYAQSCADGHPLDALSRLSPVESERFWAHTIPGPDAHLFWDGSATFYRNEPPKNIRPQRWAWIHRHGQIAPTTDVWVTCGEKNCVNVDHLAVGRVNRHPVYDRKRVLGRMQVLSLEMGKTVTAREWEGRHERPGLATIKSLFGSWDDALQAAGLQPRPGSKALYVPAKDCLQALRLASKHTILTREAYREFRAAHPHLELPAAETIVRRFGTWTAALQKAGFKR